MLKTKPTTKVMSFDEDNFDLAAHKKAADAVAKEKARVKRVRRQVAIGKVVMTIVAFLIFMLIFIIAATTGLIAL